MFGLFGWSGQHVYDWLDARKSKRVQEESESGEKEKESWLQRMGKSKWSPMRALTEEEYEDMMKERILKVDVEIALIKDKIEALKQEKENEERRRVAEGQKEPSGPINE